MHPNPISGNNPGLPSARADMIDCLDKLDTARQLIELVRMSVRDAPNGDAKAIDAGLAAAIEQFDAAKDGMEMLWEVNQPCPRA